MKVAAVALGGALGALARYGVSLAFGTPGVTAFPWATFSVNVSGSLAAGFLLSLFQHRFPQHEVVFVGLTVGFLGAYTTFSTFSAQTQQLLDRGASAVAFLYVAGSVLAGLGAAWAGFVAARVISER